MKGILFIIKEKKEGLGIHEFGFMNTKELIFSQAVHDMCKDNRCGNYGKTWACPPAVGTIDECRENILKYDSVFVFTTIFQLEDSFDYEGMLKGKKWHDQVSSRVTALWKEHLDDFLALTNEGCYKCKECTYPNAPCRFPDELYPSVEAYGVEVYPLSLSAKVKYNNGPNTVTYFGCILFNNGNT